MVRASFRSSIVSRVTGAVAALWLCGAGAAWAGGGSGDLASLQNFIDAFCVPGLFPSVNCPTLPTISQAVLQLAGWINASPAAIRSNIAYGNIPVAPYIDAGNPSRPPGLKCVPANSCVDPLDPISGSPVDPSVLSTLRPLAFKSAVNANGQPTPVQLYDSTADAFLYAVAGASPKNASLQSDTFLLFYDVPTRTNPNLPQGQVVAKFSLPLTVLNSDGTSERQVAAVLQYKVPNKSQLDCSASTITGNFSGAVDSMGNPIQSSANPADIGVNCAVVFSSSPISTTAHAIFQVAVPLLITANTDPPYINISSPPNPATPALSPSMLFNDDPGVTPTNCPDPSNPSKCLLGPNGMSIGMAPNAGPYGPPAAMSFAHYSLCADLLRQGNGQPPVPSVAAFYSIAPDGEVLLSSALSPTPPGIVCPSL
jgi:hypothetical protein